MTLRRLGSTDLKIAPLVLGGNVSSIVMLTLMPRELWPSFTIVLTSVMTSIGLVLFCLYEFVIILRETPESAFIASRTSRVCHAVASRTARAMWPLFT